MAARKLTRAYDKALKPTGLKITQFTLLAHLQALHRRFTLAIGELLAHVVRRGAAVGLRAVGLGSGVDEQPVRGGDHRYHRNHYLYDGVLRAADADPHREGRGSCGAVVARGFLSERGLRVLGSELRWVLLPSAAFAFDDLGLSWRGTRIATPQVREGRARFATSFGSCSFTEPIGDLQEMSDSWFGWAKSREKFLAGAK